MSSCLFHPRCMLLAALAFLCVWAIFGPSELREFSFTPPKPAPAAPGHPLSLPHLLVPNVGVCKGSGSQVFLLILVSTAPEHQEQRDAIRASWGGLQEIQGHLVRTLFILGEPDNSHGGNIKEVLKWEAQIEGDIVQAAFTDSYRNLTLKTLSGLAWAARYCPNVHYVLKTDDDVYINVPGLVAELDQRGKALKQHLQERDPNRGIVQADRKAKTGEKESEGAHSLYPPVPHLYLGHIHWSVYPSRLKGSRHQVSEVQWPSSRGPFPPYGSGTGYVLSAPVLRLILRAAGGVPLIPVEDVFVGVIAKRVGVAPTHSSRIAGAARYPIDRCCLGRILLSSHHMEPWEMKSAWELVRGSSGNGDMPLCSWLQEALGIVRCWILSWWYF
ncbi:beta-1,3-galactosyltransferase 4 [Phascolarctos cinereus]|uniref:Hexosyltransferase n=1 Tax=Phascolarctos cinereus TaxID=38626 RepID=A0A6P5L9V8_PHACI|nr:beta-1,3-galactosyltransferase 4 [Phascolarctos cinereus]XP_020855045.1 beta-1,3-galactosyltransferase 4 [Phascolarctos cinereus]